MKKLFTLLCALFLLTHCDLLFAQTTATFVLNPENEDATVDDYGPANNHPNEIEYFSGTWTISGTPTTWRNFFKFKLSCIPPNATIQSAELSLFYADTNSFSNADHSSLTNSNESVLQRVVGPWTENTITWNNQPAATSLDEVTLPASSSGTQDYTHMNVTPLVQQMVSNPNENWGFLLRCRNETPYARMLFASSDNPHQNRHPSLTVIYTIPLTDCFTLTLDSQGEDATVDDYGPANNHPDEIEYFSGTWTISGTPTTWRNFFKFEIPCDLSSATVQSADLNLYYATINSFSNADHSSLTNSNESVLQRVISSWTEHSVTWNNQPSSTSVDQLILPQSTSGTQDYTNLDVTAMVQQMISHPDSNYGFLLKLTNEVAYARMVFASGDNPVASKHPTLQICYALPNAVNELSGENSFSLYPNPCHSQVEIKGEFGSGNGTARVMLTDLLGQEILKQEVPVRELSHGYKISLPPVSSGIYLLNISDDHFQACRKLFVQ